MCVCVRLCLCSVIAAHMPTNPHKSDHIQNSRRNVQHEFPRIQSEILRQWPLFARAFNLFASLVDRYIFRLSISFSSSRNNSLDAAYAYCDCVQCDTRTQTDFFGLLKNHIINSADLDKLQYENR